MEDKLNHYFNQLQFDVYEPESGHFDRFEKRLKRTKAKKHYPWIQLSFAASILLLIGFGLGKRNQSSTFDLSTVSTKMAEAQNFFVNAIKIETIELEKSRNLETEKIIESTLDQLEELEDSYSNYVKELKKNGHQKKLIHAMIDNYQQRLEILKNALELINKTKNNKPLINETYL